MNRKKMDELNLFTEFLMKKADVIDYAMEIYDNTLFIDGDIVLLNKLDLLIDVDCDVGLSRHNIFKEMLIIGIYNAGFMFIKNREVTNYWRNVVENYDGFVDQQALDYFKDKFRVFEFDDSYNYGWWRLFQENHQERVNSFMIDKSNIYYQYKTLKCIHTHLYDTSDYQTVQFNKFILNMLNQN